MNVGLSIVTIGLGIWLQQFRFDPPWSYWFWLGLESPNHTYVDFFPLARWFGVVLMGIGIGNWLYAKGERQFPIVALSTALLVIGLMALGRHTLPIYLLHQPALWAVLVVGLWVWRLM